jgi:hypothetical protein
VDPQQPGPRLLWQAVRRVHVQAERGKRRPAVYDDLVVTHVGRNDGWPAHRLPDGRYRVRADLGRLEGQRRQQSESSLDLWMKRPARAHFRLSSRFRISSI